MSGRTHADIPPEKIKAWRKLMGFTQDQAADAIGITTRTYHRYEKGTDPIPLTAWFACKLKYLATEECRKMLQPQLRHELLKWLKDWATNP